MQSFQIPRPASIPGQVKRPGPPGRVPGPQPGARPGLPKPKNPAMIGGKPMVPISSLIQFTPYTDPEGASEKQEPTTGASIHEQNEKETKLSGEIDGNIEETSHKEKESSNEKAERVQLNQDPEDTQRRDLPEKRVERREDPSPLKVGRNEDTLDIDVAISPKKLEKVEETPPFGNKEKKIGFEVKERDPEEPADKQNSEVSILRENNQEKPLDVKGHDEKPPKVEKPIDDVKNDIKETPLYEEEPREMVIPPPDAYAKVSAGPFAVKNQINDNAKKNAKQFNEESNVDVEDQEETGYGDQSPSPIVQNTDIYRVNQEEQRDYGIIEEPPMSLGFGMKAKMNLMAEEIESPNGRVTSYTSKESETRREEDTALLAKLKMYEVELEREKNEKNAFKDDQERLLKENADLRAQLLNANSKLEELSNRETDTKSQDIIRKEEQIQRLKADLKSTMEGSRLITEHSNRVISESTNFKLDTEAIIVSLEQEKEQLHHKFIDYKRQVQQDYITKATTLQEIVNNLEEKNKEYEKDIQRLQADLKQKAQALHKIVSLSDNVQSTLSNWPDFEQFYRKPQYDYKVIQTENYSYEPVEVEKPAPVAVVNEVIEQNIESQPVVESLNSNEALQEPDTETVNEEDYEAYDTKEEVTASRPTIIEPEVNTILTVQHDHYHQEYKPSYDNVEEQQGENAWEVEEPVMEDTEYQQEEQPLDNAWGTEEPAIEDTGYNYEDQPVENGWETEEPLVEDNEYRQEDQPVENTWEVEEPALEDTEYNQEDQGGENGWETEEPIVEDAGYNQEDTEYRQEEQQQEYQEEQAYQEEQEYQKFEAEQEEERQEEEVRDEIAVYESEIPPHHYGASVNVAIVRQEDPEDQGRHEIHGEKVSQDAFSAPPNYRLPQKKKKAVPAPRQFAGFKPANTAFGMPQEPPVVDTQEEYAQEGNYVDPNIVQTDYQGHEEKPQETHYQDPEENNTKPPIFYNTIQPKTKPPQFGKAPFAGVNHVPKAQPFYPNKLSPNDKLRGNHINESDPYAEQSNFNEENPALGSKQTSLGASMPRQNIDYANTAPSEEYDEQNGINKPYEHGNKYEMNGHSNNVHSNGHEQNNANGRVVPSSKVIKKRLPGSGSIF